MEWVTVLTAVAFGAVITSLVAVIGGWRERVYRRRELLFRQAIDMAKTNGGRQGKRLHRDAAR